MPTDPSDPQPSSRYQTTAAPSKGSGGGIFFVVLLLLVLGGGAAYYFLFYKATAANIAAASVVAPTASAGAPAPVPSATPAKPTPYDAATRQQYIDTAISAFRAERQSKNQPFTEAFAALMSAGGFSAAGLPSKDAITARRDLVKKCLAANDDYAAYVKDQEAAYTAQLKKTPLTANDVEVDASVTGAKMPTDKMIQLRTLQGDSLKVGDQMLEYLDSKFGAWSVNAEKHLVFKKPADGNPFSALAKTYSEQVASLNKLRDEINKNETVDPTASAAATTTGAASPAPAASVAP